MWAEIVGGVVKRVTGGDDPTDKLGGTWVDVSGVTPRPGPRWAYDGTDFTPPAPPPEPAPQTVIGTGDFIRRLTDDEFRAMVIAAKTDDDVLVLEKKLGYLPTVDLASPDMDAALTALQVKGHITPARKTEILTP